MRLRHSDPARPGWTRRRRGSGFSYVDASGARLPADEVARIKALAIPPAWVDVWISPDRKGHIQAVGTDAAGRHQYRYHDEWRVRRDAAKFDHVLSMAVRLPDIRSAVDIGLAAHGLGRDRVLAAAVRLLDVGCFRIGGEVYAAGDDGTFGLATVRREHVELIRGGVRFRYPAKGGIERDLDVHDPRLRTVVRGLLERSDGSEELLAHRDGDHWCDVRSADINAYLREISGMEISAKDFRTWNGTVRAAAFLAEAEVQPGAEAGAGVGVGVGAKIAGRGKVGRTARRKVLVRAMQEVSAHLGNTPAVARASYVDPRVTDLYLDGVTIPPGLVDPTKIEAAVLDLLAD